MIGEVGKLAEWFALNVKRNSHDYSPSSDLNAGDTHLLNRPRTIARLEIDAANCVEEQRHSEAKVDRIESRCFDAVIGRQTCDMHLVDAAAAEVFRQTSRLPTGIIEEGAITVDLRIDSFANDMIDRSVVQFGSQFGSLFSLNAMRRPKHLLKIGDMNDVADAMFWMFGGERLMLGRMPILRRHDDVVLRDELIDGLDHFVAAGHSQRAAREEVILDVDDE
jgi:hypothetical protein